MVQTNTTVLLAFSVNTGGECSRSEVENQVQGLGLAKSSDNKNLPQMLFFLPILLVLVCLPLRNAFSEVGIRDAFSWLLYYIWMPFSLL